MISEISQSSKEVKVPGFMRKSGQYFLLSKEFEKWFPKSAIFHRSPIPSIDNRMHYSFDAIDIKGICNKINTLNRNFKIGFVFANHSSNECNKRKLLILIKKIKLLVVPFFANY